MKLTIKNYKEAARNIDFKKLPGAAQEAHKEFDSFAVSTPPTPYFNFQDM